jgi:antitoxin HicB
MAREALTGVLEVRLEYDELARTPSRLGGKNVRWVEPELSVGVAVTLRVIRKKQGLTMKEIAARMNVSVGDYQRLEDPQRSNPTVRKLQEVCKALNIEIEDLFRKRAA